MGLRDWKSMGRYGWEIQGRENKEWKDDRMNPITVQKNGKLEEETNTISM